MANTLLGPNRIFGVYTATWNGVSIGDTTVDGFKLIYSVLEKKLSPTQTYGDTYIDGIFRGGNCRISFTLAEWVAGGKALLWPHTGGSGFDGTFTTVGKRISGFSSALVLTAAAGTPAAAAGGPATLTSAYAKLASDTDIDLLLGPDNRDIPIVMDLLPYNDGTYNRWFSVT